MLNVIYLHEPGHIPALRRHYGNFDTTIVSQRDSHRLEYQPAGGACQQPDLLVAFDVDRAAIIARKGYDILRVGQSAGVRLGNRVGEHRAK